MRKELPKDSKPLMPPGSIKKCVNGKRKITKKMRRRIPTRENQALLGYPTLLDSTGNVCIDTHQRLYTVFSNLFLIQLFLSSLFDTLSRISGCQTGPSDDCQHRAKEPKTTSLRSSQSSQSFGCPFIEGKAPTGSQSQPDQVTTPLPFRKQMVRECPCPDCQRFGGPGPR